MADKIREKIDEQIKWLEREIVDCNDKSFTETAMGRRYLEVLEGSLRQFKDLTQ